MSDPLGPRPDDPLRAQTHWYYIKKDLVGDDTTIGPIDHVSFLSEVRDGKHKLKTLVTSEQLQGQWHELQAVPVLKVAYGEGNLEREKAKEQARQEREEKRLRAQAAAQQRRHEAEEKRAEEERKRQEAQREEQRWNEKERFAAETRQVFDRYWMPEYLRSVWIAGLILCGLFVGLFGLSFVFEVAVNPGDDATTSFVVLLLAAVAALAFLIALRLTLESFAVLFDIRGLLKRFVESELEGARRHDQTEGPRAGEAGRV